MSLCFAKYNILEAKGKRCPLPAARRPMRDAYCGIDDILGVAK
jgi:hypothetical protein